MSKSRFGKTDRAMEDAIAQFVGVTGASVKDAKKFLEKHNKRVEIAIDAYYNDPAAMAATARNQSSNAPSTSKLNALFDKYKDKDGEDITIDGTIKMCEDWGVDPEDVVLLAVAYELKSPSMGLWRRKEWVDGWRNLGCDSVASIKTQLPKLRDRLSSNPVYFREVYAYTFTFSLGDGQRSLAMDTAQAFWALLIPHGLKGGALSHKQESLDDGEDVHMSSPNDPSEKGWEPQFTDWWLEFMSKKGGKGVSKDTWLMFLDFVRSIDSKFKKYDETAAWPSTIDDFVYWVRENKLTT